MAHNSTLHVSFPASLKDISEYELNALVATDQPFLKHGFFSALEESGCVCRATGWEPHHFAVRDAQGVLVAFAPVYLKYHSYGEYIFDWSWADAYQKNAMDYYPKLLTSIPFTPTSSARLLLNEGDGLAEQCSQLYRTTLERYCEHQQVSSAHVLFPEPSSPNERFFAGWLKREGLQYHWFNKGYTSFDAFLQSLNASKRKNIRKERKRLITDGFEYVWRRAAELSEAERRCFFACYKRTYNVRGQMPYLNEAFFELLFERLSEECLLLFAIDRSGDLCASALYLQGENCLYGRYWGAITEAPYLHFELCYYAGIERCIELMGSAMIPGPGAVQ